MTKTKSKVELGGLFYPTRDINGKDIPFDSLFIPYIYKEIYFEGVYVDILNGQKDMTILDIGSNIGITIQHFRPFAKRVVGVEPSSEHFMALAKNKEFNKWDNVQLFNVALSDKNGEATLSAHESNRTCNSITNNYGNGETVKTMDFETLFKEAGIDKVDFCKFDVEGADDLILRGESFRKVAPKINSIMVEFHHATWPDLVEYIISLGYKARRYESSAIIVLFTKN